MRTPNRSRLLALALGASLVVAACGGDDDDTQATTTVAPAPTTAAPSDTTRAATTAPPIPSTTAATDLPDCPVDALDDASGPVEITFWHAMAAELGEAIAGIVDTYNQSQQRVKVNYQFQGGYDETFDKYRAASAGDRPEVVQLPEYYLQVMTDSNTAIAVQSCINADPSFAVDELLPRAVGFYSIEGALRAMPFNVSNPVYYYNRKTAIAAGLDPDDPPTTLDELKTWAEKMTATDAATYGLVLETGPDSGGGWFLEQWFAKAGQLYADSGNGREALATKVLFDDPLGRSLMTYLQDLVKSGAAVKVATSADPNADLAKLADPKEPAASTLHTSAAIGPVIDILKAGAVAGFADEDLGIGPLPGPEGDGGVVVGGASLWLMADKDPVKTAAAWDFIKYMASAQTQSTWASITGYLPMNTKAPDLDPIKSLYAADPRFKVAYDQLLTGAENLATAGPVLGPQRQVRAVTAKAMDAILDGADVGTTLQSAAAEADALLEDYRKRSGG